MASNKLKEEQHFTSGKSVESGEEFSFFYGNKSAFSQWHKAKFTVDGTEYNCAEQYMMHQKAVLFKDKEKASSILREKNPREQKAMGRKVKNFDQEVWDKHCKEIVRKGNLEKNPALGDVLLSTGNSSLVEASPNDCIWGIGLDHKSAQATNRREWRGTNWLGEILTNVRIEVDKRRKKDSAIADRDRSPH